jgi:peptidyl-prolyl cis-trans isomerase A (cyclophilin A)
MNPVYHWSDQAMKSLFILCLTALCGLMPAPAVRAAEEADHATTATQPATALVRVKTTLGDIDLELDPAKAPITVLNFLTYAEESFYEGTVFHRVIPDFMIQGGGYTVAMDEMEVGLHPGIRNEWRNGLKNDRGTVAMARLGGRPDSATAQFFINTVDNPRLDQPQADGAAYCVFGKVVKGLEVVDIIRNTKLIMHPNYPAGGQPVTPETPVVIESVTVLNGFKPELMRAALEAKDNAALKAREEAAKAKDEQGKKERDDRIAKIEEETGKKLTKTKSGLMYVTVREGDGPMPVAANRVKVHYRGTLLNGKQFDSSYDRGAPTTFGLKQVIKGWTEGLALMKVGGKSILVIPPELGYGPMAMGTDIPANSWLVFEVELLQIL